MTIVLGIGNLVHSDDGAGVRAVRELESDPRVPRHVRLIDGGTLGLALLPRICGVRRLLVIDAIDVGEPPGTILRFDGRALKGLPGRASIHQIGFADMMSALELIGEPPEDVVVLGVQPASTDWSAELSPAVAGALPALVQCAIGELEAWSGQAGSAADKLAEPCATF